MMGPADWMNEPCTQLFPRPPCVLSMLPHVVVYMFL